MVTTTQTSATPTWANVFSTAKGAIYQCDEERCWYVDFAGKVAKFDYRCLLKLKKAVYHVDIEDRLLNSGKDPDVEIIFICACDHCYVLSLLQIIALKEILEGTFVMLQLNNIIHDVLYRIAQYLD
ncbi:hypothetical protein DYU05_20265 [Mucilaginibacter terrenus]|uniref:Uncharacterized protein n=1 Tax=Mucilaginibacter terrenus TaxID=2482727 RepID=A0A3E2NJB1_9SPHI|nr:hypothetical protein [Mucilaginibacter terrenus]RFZ81097.1 hypothetical protein DYU05_20265 [Mucilaginibacter terrenus]